MAKGQVNLEQIEGYAKALREGRPILLRKLAEAYQKMGRQDITKIRQNVAAAFGRSSVKNAFRFKATDPDRATDFSKLFLTEFTKWKGAEVFQTGGTIVGHGKNLTILTPEGRGPGGRARFTPEQIRAMLASGKLRWVPTPRGVLIVETIGGLTKKGKGRRGSRDRIIAVLRRQVTEKKRLDFYETVEGNDGLRQQILETAVEDTLEEIAKQGRK